MAAPFFETLALTCFIKRTADESARMTTIVALIKAITLPKKNVAKALTKTLLPVTLFVHPDKLDEDDKSLGEALFKSMRNPATGSIYKDIRAVNRAEDWYRNAWLTAVANSLEVTPNVDILAKLGLKLLNKEEMQEATKQIIEDREDDKEIVEAADLLQAKLTKKFAKKQATGKMSVDSQAIVVYTNTFLTGAIDKLRVGGATRTDRATIQRDIFAAVSHITSELNTPTRTATITEADTASDDGNSADTASDDGDVPMTEAKQGSPAATLKRSRDESDGDISVESSPTKRARKALKSRGRGTPIADMGSINSQLPRMLNLVSHWALSLKADNPARKCTANEENSKLYLTTISKVLQRNFPLDGSIDQESIEELTKKDILLDQACWPISAKNGNQVAHMRKLCAWARFQEYVSSLDIEEFNCLVADLQMTDRRVPDVRFLDLPKDK